MLVEFVIVLDVGLALAMLDLVQRWLGNIDVSALNQLRHLPVEKREQQGANMRAIDVGVRHDDDAVVTQLCDVEILDADAATKRRHQSHDLLA